jgi:hypothetical protein
MSPAERDPLDPLADVRSESIAATSPGYRITVTLIFSLRLEVERWRPRYVSSCVACQSSTQPS